MPRKKDGGALVGKFRDRVIGTPTMPSNFGRYGSPMSCRVVSGDGPMACRVSQEAVEQLGGAAGDFEATMFGV